jgi:hypothetical protein
MLIACPQCRARVDAQERGQAKWIYKDEEGRKGGRLDRLLRCPVCYSAMLTQQQLTDSDDESWSDPKRLWPSDPLETLGWMPSPISHALAEAQRCLFCKAHSASVVMSVQAIEGICQEYKTKSSKLFEGLKELRAREIIDKKLYEWADELRAHRNLAAHATGTQFTRLDAQDIFNFARAICEYVFVLTVKFNRFKERTTARKRK